MSDKRSLFPLTRRSFLAAAAATLGFRPPACVRADEPVEIAAPPRDDTTNQGVDPQRLIVAMMGDPQLHMNPHSLEHAETAMNDLADTPHDFLAVLGDLVQNRPEYYEDYRRLILDPATKPVYSIAGNADLNASLEAYQRCVGLPPYYTILRRGIRFIFTSVTSVTGRTAHICDLGNEQLAWLEKELAADTRSTTVVMFHAPVFETTWRSEDREALSFPGSMYMKESARMRQLLARHDNVKIYAHGHLHHAYGVRDEFGRGEYCLADGVLHISVGATANNRGSSLLHFENDKIVAKVRDHAGGRWRDEFEYTLVGKTTLAPAAV